MFSLNAKKRDSKAEPNFIPAILYGPDIKDNILISVSKKELTKLLKEAGESSLIEVKLEDKVYPALIHGYQTEQITCEITHIDFYNPILSKEVEAEVVIEFTGQANAISLGGNLLHNLQVLHVKALPQNLPQKIEVNIDSLETFEDKILVKDINLGKNVTIIEGENEIIAHVVEQPKQAEQEVEEETKEEETKEEAKEESSNE